MFAGPRWRSDGLAVPAVDLGSAITALATSGSARAVRSGGAVSAAVAVLVAPVMVLGLFRGGLIVASQPVDRTNELEAVRY